MKEHLLANYETIDADDIVRIPTGIKALDKLLDGGIACGELTVLSSCEGSGKSTLTSQIVSYAVDHGFKSMIYSGEMSGESVLSTMLKQIAGYRWTSSSQVVDGRLVEFQFDTYVPEATAEYIKAHVLGENVRFFGGSDIRTWDDLKRAMEGAYDAGVRLFVIDNLMTLTALFGSDTANSTAYGTDQYYQQTGAVQYLNDFAITKQCSVMLVAHTKKGGAGIDDEGNDGIYGTSAVKNLAGLVLRFLAPGAKERAQYKKALAAEEGDDYAEEHAPKFETDRLLRVTKNRITGKRGDITVRYRETLCRYYDDTMCKEDDISDDDYSQRITENGYDYGMLWERDYLAYLAKKAGVDAPKNKIIDGTVKYYEEKEAARKQRLEAKNHPSDLNRQQTDLELFFGLLK